MNEIERALVGWFEASRYPVEHDGAEWFVWVNDVMLPLTEIALAIKEEQHRAAEQGAQGS